MCSGCVGVSKMEISPVHIPSRWSVGQCHIFERSKCHISRVEEKSNYISWRRIIVKSDLLIFQTFSLHSTGSVPIHITDQYLIFSVASWISECCSRRRLWKWRTTIPQNDRRSRSTGHEKWCYSLLDLGKIKVIQPINNWMYFWDEFHFPKETLVY